jgi:CRP-like cAMP-binding protein
MRGKIAFEVRHYAAGAELARQDEPGREAYLILRGRVAIEVWHGAKVMRVFKAAGDVVGEMALVDSSPRSATLLAEDDLEVEVITFTDFHSMLNACHPKVQTAVKQLTQLLRDADRGASRAATQAALRELKAKVTGLPDFPSFLEGCHSVLRAVVVGLLERLGTPDARLVSPRR